MGIAVVVMVVSSVADCASIFTATTKGVTLRVSATVESSSTSTAIVEVVLCVCAQGYTVQYTLLVYTDVRSNLARWW